jgi:type IV pilus assembly protein PilV
MSVMQTHLLSRTGDQRGTTMLEVLITIFIVVIGLLGLAGLQARIQAAELESYQRVQALVLLQDMVDRLKANRHQAVSYVTGSTPLGTGVAVGVCGAMTGYQRDKCEWSNALLGASEVTSGGASVGAMIGARGCVENTVAAMPYEFVVAVAWQGLTPTAVPTASTCGQNLYGTNDANRRVVTARVVFSCLQNEDDGVTCATATP